MIVSLVVTGKHNLNINSSRVMKAGEHIVNVDKDIPFIRYRFDNYDDESIQYIQSVMSNTERVTHLAEINLDANTVDNLSKLPAMAKFVYSEITEEEVKNAQLNEDRLQMISSLAAAVNSIDRFMFRDKSKTLDTVTYRKFVAVVARITGISQDNIGICSSPLSFGEDCCLSAIKARDLMSKYSKISDVALPSANHQSMNCCGCIRYIVIDSDNPVVSESAKKGKPTENKEKTESKPKSVAKPKQTLKPGMFRL